MAPIEARRAAAAAYNVTVRRAASRMGVHDPLFNLREIAKNLILLEDHLSHRNKICPDCIRKHLLCVEGLAEEATCLDPSGDLAAGMEGLAETARGWLESFTDGAEPFGIAGRIREVRKTLVPLSFDPRGRTARVAAIILDRKRCPHGVPGRGK